MPLLEFRCETGPVRLHYETAGEGPGQPVLLIMGLAAEGRGWENQIDPLAAHHPVAWFDHRGVGRTRARPGRYSMALFTEDVRRLLDHLGWDRAHVVGVSMGGMIAQHVALTFPERLISLSLIVTHAGGRRPRLPRPPGIARFARVAVLPGRGRVAALERLLFPAEHLARIDRHDLRRRLRTQFKAIPRRYLLSQLSAVMGHRTAHRLHRIDTPTLVIAAPHDVVIHPRESHRLHRLIPGSRLITFDDAGHGVIRQKGPEISRALLDHFAASEG